jgi:tetratricopeptide (TPR) repeat protein
MAFLAGRLLLYRPDFALLPPGGGTLAEALTDPRIGWKLVYVDDAGAVLLPPNSPRLREPLPDPETVVGDDPQWQVAMAQILLSRGDSQGARELLERALARESLLPLAYGRLAQAAAHDHDLAGIEAAIARGVAVEPRFEPPLRQQEATAFELAGDPARALAALERAVPRGPFSRPEGVLQSLERLRQRVAQR